MKVEPTEWKFHSKEDMCCSNFRIHAFDDMGMIPGLTTNGTLVFFNNTAITHCPFCGKKIELERVLNE